MPDLSPLRLTTRQLASVRDAMRDAIRAGLTKPDQEVRALPAFLRRPAGDLKGRVVALDVGGTHMRAGWVELNRRKARMLGPTGENELMEQAARREISREKFFSTEAKLIADACPDREIAVGYCFSYPATITPKIEAILIEWTKGIRVADTVGKPVGKLLAEALKKRSKKVTSIPVLNDTVASLLAGAALAPKLDRIIGVIVGTGTNMAGFFPVRAITKLSAKDRAGWGGDEPMAVNLESGNFNPRGVLTTWDRALDKSRPDERDKHHFEKAISGAYLPQLLWQVAGADSCRKAGFDVADPKSDAAAVERLRGKGAVGEAASAIIDRSADLVAAGLAGMIAAQGGRGTIGILVEGSLFHKTKGYARRVRARLKELAPRAKTKFIDAESGKVPPNFLGAACAALTHRDNRS